MHLQYKRIYPLVLGFLVWCVYRHIKNTDAEVIESVRNPISTLMDMDDEVGTLSGMHLNRRDHAKPWDAAAALFSNSSLRLRTLRRIPFIQAAASSSIQFNNISKEESPTAGPKPSRQRRERQPYPPSRPLPRRHCRSEDLQEGQEEK